MIIIEGPNTALRDTLRLEIERRLRPELGAQLVVYVSSTPAFGTSAEVVRALNAPNQTELCDGLGLGFPDDHPIHHMAGYALSATGSVVVLAMDKNDDYAGMNRPPICDQITHLITWGEDLPRVIDLLLKAWKKRQEEVAISYRFGGTGFMDHDGIMIVGERVNPFRNRLTDATMEEWAPLAFTSNQGCSFFLHDALRASGGTFYLTNAVKTLNKKLNRSLLAEELATMQPRRIIAMGNEAASALAEQRVDFVQTYHPQYWKRFKNKDVGELVELLRSASITNKTKQL